MIGKRIFVDTAPFIYVQESHSAFGSKVIDYIQPAFLADAVFLTSVVTYSEYGVLPERLGRQDLIHEFDAFLSGYGFEVIDVNHAIATTAYQLRAKYAFLRGMDALQLATAIEQRADAFPTNDRKLKAVQEMKVVLVAEL